MPEETAKTGQEYHLLSEKTREHGQDFLTALDNATRATVKYIKEGNLAGAAEAEASAAISWKHLILEASSEQEKQALGISGKHESLKSIEHAQLAGTPEAAILPLFELAKILEVLGNDKEALEYFQKAVDSVLPPSHNRPAVRADMKSHLAMCSYRIATTPEQKTASLKKAREAVDELTNSGEEKDSIYTYHVWLSGAYLRMAEALYVDTPQEAKDYLEKAGKIIEEDNSLILRKKQYEKLKNTLRQQQMERYNKENIL